MAEDEARRKLSNKPKNKAETMEEDDEEDEFFEVDQIIGKSKVKGVVSYKVRWKGYGSEEDTWEPVDNLDSCKDLVDDFNKKREESMRQKAEERKLRQAIMEGRISSPDSAEDATHSPYPPNFKNSFWKELEAGRIDVFDSSIYSKVKERSVKLQSLKEYKELENDSDKKSFEEIKLQSTDCTPSRKSKYRSSTKSSKSKHHSSSKSKKKNVKSPETHRNDIIVQSESDSDSDIKCSKIMTDQEKEKQPNLNASEKDQPKGIKLIMKLPRPPGDKDGTVVVTTKHVSSGDLYSVGSPAGVQRESTKEKNEPWPNMKKKKSKHKRNSKHGEHKVNPTDKEYRQRQTEHDKGDSGKSLPKNDPSRKRKISETVETDIRSDNVKNSFDLKTEKDDPNNAEKGREIVTKGCEPFIEQVFKSEIEVTPVESEKLNPLYGNVSQKKYSFETPKQDTINAKKDKAEYSCLNWNVPNSNVTGTGGEPKQAAGISAIKQEQSLDLSPTFRSHTTYNCASVSHISTPISHNCATLSFNTTAPIGCALSTPCANLDPNVTAIKHSPQETILGCNNTGTMRRDSETVDSGIASPASEKSLGLFKSEFMTPVEEDLSQSILPFLADPDKSQEKEADQEFDIDLDEIDWEMFDRDVNLEPIMLSNDAFVRAVMTGDYGLVKRALMGDGKYNLEHTDPAGKTLLAHAVQHGYDDIADLLIEHGANTNSQMADGLTPLMVACQYAELCTVNLLIELGAKVNMQAFNGESALMMAVRRGHRHITWLLLESGANFSLKSVTGHTALNYARALRNIDTESVITTHIDRVMSEFLRQVSVTLNNLANIREMVFPPQVFNISEEEMFYINFNYSSQLPPSPGLGYLLFLGHAVFTSEEVKCRLYGPCAIKTACLNGVALSPLTSGGNFVLAFNPITSGNNLLTINTVKETDMKGKLIVCAYKAQIV